MNLSKLFEMQRALDEKIVKEKGLDGQDLLPQKILALQVELGELANEWRGFKFWSENQNPRVVYKGSCDRCDYWEKLDGDRRSLRPDGSECDCYQGLMRADTVLEEYVDCLHFILSIGLDIGLTNPKRENLHEELVNTTEAFQHAFNWCATLDFARSQGIWNGKGKAYERLVDVFIALGYFLGFSWEQIEAAYIAKNEVNHSRQANGY